MKKIVYVGIMFFEKRNALCQRAFSILKSASDLGYSTVAIGFSDKRKETINTVEILNGVECYSIPYPSTAKEWIKSLYDADPIIDVLKTIGIENIETVILADYRFFASARIKEYCEKNNVKFVADIMDWFSQINSFNINEIVKIIDTWLKIYLFYPLVDRKICISRSFYNMYRKTERIALIPGTIIPDEPKWNLKDDFDVSDVVRVSFAGVAGKHCKKERLDWLIQAVCELNEESAVEHKIYLEIAGATKEEFYADNPKMIQFINNENIKFHGIATHEKCLEIISQSCFSVVPRENNRLSRFGFSTKISEALACGTPVIATRTSDVSLYIEDGLNGYLCECDYQSLKQTIKKACLMELEAIKAMKKFCKIQNPLTYDKFTKDLKEVL